MEPPKKRKAPETDEEGDEKVEEPGDDGSADDGGGKRPKKSNEDVVRCPLSSVFAAMHMTGAGDFVESTNKKRHCEWSGTASGFLTHWDDKHSQSGSTDAIDFKGAHLLRRIVLDDGPPTSVFMCEWRIPYGNVHFVGTVFTAGGAYYVPTIWHTGAADAEYNVDVGFACKTYMRHERVVAFPLRRVPTDAHIAVQPPVGDLVVLSKKLADRHFGSPLSERGTKVPVFIRPHVAVNESVFTALSKGFHFD
jgi:hypothetical protein